jgi:NADPH:quinone reductase-like Zn-dependent oxidoreductase
MILGHEIAGEIISIGEGTPGFAIGDRVAVNPSQAHHLLLLSEGATEPLPRHAVLEKSICLSPAPRLS